MTQARFRAQLEGHAKIVAAQAEELGKRAAASDEMARDAEKLRLS
ncbi:hypothetical protein [Actinomycetospora endophytica]|nr:hypothetical protein [Actinomycetospora endophytica]